MTATTGLDPAAGGGFRDKLAQLAVILGPTTVLTGALYYVGHISARAFYSYFGVSLSALDISTSSILLRSVDDLFDPLSVVVLLGFAAFALHHLFVATVVRRSPRTSRRLAMAFSTAGLVLAGFGLAGLFNLVRSPATPWALGLSGIALEYVCWLTTRATRAQSALGGLVRAGVNLRRGLIAALILIATLWGATAVADARGTARARVVEQSLPVLSQAVVYSRTDLRLTGPGVIRTELSGAEAEDFHYRYKGLRPLLHSNDTWLLLPVGWNSQDRPPVILLADSPDRVRVDLAR